MSRWWKGTKIWSLNANIGILRNRRGMEVQGEARPGNHDPRGRRHFMLGSPRYTKFVGLRPDVPWQELPLTAQGIDLCSEILASGSCDRPLRSRLDKLTKGIWGRVFGLGSD